MVEEQEEEEEEEGRPRIGWTGRNGREVKNGEE